MWLAKLGKGMLSSVEQAFVGREEIRAHLKTTAWEATTPPGKKCFHMLLQIYRIHSRSSLIPLWSLFDFSFSLHLCYSRTSLIRTPKGQSEVSVLERCPYTFRKSLFDIQRLGFWNQIAHQTNGIHPVQIHLIGIRDLPDHRRVRTKEVRFIRIHSLGPTFSARWPY